MVQTETLKRLAKKDPRIEGYVRNEAGGHTLRAESITNVYQDYYHEQITEKEPIPRG